MSKIDLQDRIKLWEETMNSTIPMSKEAFSHLAQKVNKEEKRKKFVGTTKFLSLFLMTLSSLGFMEDRVSMILQGILSIICFILFMRIYRFNTKLNNVDKTLDLSSFLEHRKRITNEGLNFLKFTRVLIYPMLFLFLGNNTYYSYNKWGLWSSVLVVFVSIALMIYIKRIVDESLDDYQTQLNTLS